MTMKRVKGDPAANRGLVAFLIILTYCDNKKCMRGGRIEACLYLLWIICVK